MNINIGAEVFSIVKHKILATKTPNFHQKSKRKHLSGDFPQSDY